jgi:cytochrome b561
MPANNPIHHSWGTKLLHFSLLLCVLWQLIVVDWAERPRPDRPGNFFYQVHQWVGLVTLGVVVLFWLWVVVRRAETSFLALFPWFSPRRLAAIRDDLRVYLASVRQLRLPSADEESPLVSAVHGLGFLTALAMGLSGAWLFTMSIPAGLILDLHKAVSNLMWAYLVSHAGLALLHQLLGHRVLQRMFSGHP